MSTAMTVSEKIASTRQLLEQSKTQLAMALPRHLTPERMMRVAMTCIQKSPELLNCTQHSIIGAIVEASQLGLEPDGILGHGYLIPFRNKKTGNQEAQFIPGYKGLMDLARRSGQISTISARIVFARDEYEFEFGLEEKLYHRPTQKPERGEMIAAYAVAHLRDRGRQFEWMWKHEVDAIRDKSQARKFGPWVDYYEPMAIKTAIRKLCKMLPVSVELTRAVALDEQADAGVQVDYGDIVDIPAFAAGEEPSELDAVAGKLEAEQLGDREHQPPQDDESKHDANKKRIKESAEKRRKKPEQEKTEEQPEPDAAEKTPAGQLY